jgi:ATP-dependent helicase IRC3
VPTPDRVTYTDYDDPFAFVQGSRGAPHLARLSPNSWVSCGADVYVLELLGRGHLRVQPARAEEGGPKFTAHYAPRTMSFGMRQAIGLQHGMQRARPVLDADSLEDAIRGCDQYAKQKVLVGPQAMGCVPRHASLRARPLKVASIQATDERQVAQGPRDAFAEGLHPQAVEGSRRRA